MILNKSMEQYLNTITVGHIEPQAEYPIWRKLNQAGQPYWGVGDFCGIVTSSVDGDCDLMELEWNGNEVHISCPDNIVNMLIYGLGIVSAWKIQLETEYTNTAFDIVLSVDEGNKDITPSITIRFWAIRNQEHYINPSMLELERFSQPVLMEQANYTLLE